MAKLVNDCKITRANIDCITAYLSDYDEVILPKMNRQVAHQVDG
jgi:hypothetical protein